MEKVVQADDFSGVAIAGAAGPAMEMVKLFQLQIEHYEKVEGQPLSLEGKANQLSMFVQKGNPKNVRANLNELLRPDLVLNLGNAQSGSVGQASKSLLDRFKLYPRAVSKAAFLLPDSRALTLSLKRGEADVTLCWRATAFFPDNSPHMDVVDLSPAIASPQALLVNLLTFSNHTAAASRFIDLMVSPQGQAVFRKHGFLDASLKS
jgi:molybdate transport system substrate-binding protein